MAWRRLPLLAGAAVALAAGITGGLALLIEAMPAPASFTEHHGPLMALGFLGTLIALERAVALRRPWGYAAPALAAAGAVALAAGAEQTGRLALTAAGGWLVGVYLALLGRRRSRETFLQLGGALAWPAAGLLWLAGRPVAELAVWFAAFLVLTIAAERLELAHVVFLRPAAWAGLLAATAVVGAGAVVSLLAPAAGARTAGAGMVAVAGWLAFHDVARRTVRGSGLPRYAAVCLLAGYGWLAMAGALWSITGLASGRYLYDAALHALFLGFVMSMVFGHAPVILPAVLRVRLPYRPVLYAPLAALHAAVGLRVAGDLAAAAVVRTLGGVLAAVALLLFAGCAFALTRSGRARVAPPRGPVGAPQPPRGPRASWRPRANPGVVVGCLLTAAAVVVAVTGVSAPPTVTATGSRTVDVTLSGMRVRPAVIEAPVGTVLTLRVTNADAQRHDLRLATGERTPMLASGQSSTLRLRPLGEAVDGWCTVAGHRAAGMTLRITPTGSAAATRPDQGTGHDGHGSPAAAQPDAPARLDLAAPMSPGWTPYDAALKPAPGGTEHRVEIRADDTVVQEVAPGVRQRVWTFNGTMPGPVLRGKVGDVFTVTFVNDGSMGHGIDFHAGANAPDGPMRTIQPGERLTYRFRAEFAGAWLYHCSTMPMTQHIANGMYGAVIIDPPDLPDVGREYLLVQGELYLGEPGSQAQVAKIRQGDPDGWMFNGTAAGYDHAPLTATAGERVRIWAVAAGPGTGTALHVVGAPFDTVYTEGAYRLRAGDPGGAQVLDLAPAQGGFVELVFPEPGTYPVVDHTMHQAEAGAHGLVKVSAPQDD
ncbi:multicopper oxidase domain-containing protein [Nonomuraea indica]|uniref:multicopper oxidase domain-containing protein n=1 Tax=Nonomuraea indica TaxID=1581193 RepID=UPI001FE59056|nr:multicopper oxidase domain-containing protein [Nonomuraea indica]